MIYNFNFSLCSIFFLALTAFFYLRQKRVHDRPDRIFTLMLASGSLAVVFDVVAAAIEPYSIYHPIWCVYIFNFLFVLGLQACLPLFCLYTLDNAGLYRRLSKPLRALILLPYMIIVLLVIISAFTKLGIFYIDGSHTYRHGATHILLYVSAALYMLISGAILLLYGRKIERARRIVIISFMLLLFVAMGLQMAFPNQLLTTSATALGLAAMFYILQDPEDHIDPVSGAFNRTVLYSVLDDVAERRGSYSMIVFYVPSFNLLTSMLGVSAGDGIINEMAAYLQNAFPGRYVIAMDFAQFVVVERAEIAPERLESIRRALPESFAPEGCASVRMPVKMAYIPCSEHPDIQHAMRTADYVLQSDSGSEDGCFTAGAAFREDYDEKLGLEADIERLLADDSTKLELVPVLRDDGGVAAYDVTLSLKDERSRLINSEELFVAAERAGCVRLFEELLAKKLGQHIAGEGKHWKYGIPLSLMECMQGDSAGYLKSVFAQNGIPMQDVCVGIMESEMLSSLPSVRKNIDELVDAGCSLQLDGFAAGYTSMDILFELNFVYVRIDRSLLRAASDKRRAELLKGIITVLGELGQRAVCMGVDSDADRETVKQLGVRLYRA